jgi:hypothetical protein
MNGALVSIPSTNRQNKTRKKEKKETHVCVDICVYICIYTYTYVERERGGKEERDYKEPKSPITSLP